MAQQQLDPWFPGKGDEKKPFYMMGVGYTHLFKHFNPGSEASRGRAAKKLTEGFLNHRWALLGSMHVKVQARIEDAEAADPEDQDIPENPVLNKTGELGFPIPRVVVYFRKDEKQQDSFGVRICRILSVEDCDSKFADALRAYSKHEDGESAIIKSLRVEVVTVDNIFAEDVLFMDCPCEVCERRSCGTKLYTGEIVEVQVNAQYMLYAEAEEKPPAKLEMDLPGRATRPLLGSVKKGEPVRRPNPPLAGTQNHVLYKSPPEMHLGVQGVRFQQLLTTYGQDQTWTDFKKFLIAHVQENMMKNKREDEETYYGYCVYKYVPQTVSSTTALSDMSAVAPFSFNPHIKKIGSFEEATSHVEMLLRSFQLLLARALAEQKAVHLGKSQSKKEKEKIRDLEAHVFFEFSYYMLYDLAGEATLESCCCPDCSPR